jgi:hypothetical protein
MIEHLAVVAGSICLVASLLWSDKVVAFFTLPKEIAISEDMQLLLDEFIGYLNSPDDWSVVQNSFQFRKNEKIQLYVNSRMIDAYTDCIVATLYVGGVRVDLPLEPAVDIAEALTKIKKLQETAQKVESVKEAVRILQKGKNDNS